MSDLTGIVITVIIGLFVVSIGTGCAATRGFMTGVTGGVRTVEDVVNGGADSGTTKSETQRLVHIGFTTAMCVFTIPLCATYLGVSGIYGGYAFHKEYKDE